MNPWIASAIAVFIYMNLGFVLSLVLKRNDLADMMWGPGFLIASLAMDPVRGPRAYIVFIAIALWAARLSGFVLTRNLGAAEDWRYKAWREAWGKTFFVRSYFQVWILQGLLMFAIFYPLGLQMLEGDAAPDTLFYIGLAIWAFGFLFEAIGDEQLRRYKKNPANRGKVMQRGLWRYTRHPNYFGEATLWWGFAIAALTLSGGYYAPVSAALITFMLLRVSGVTMLEKSMEKKPDFAAYRARTSAFIPWPPKGTRE